MLPMHPHEGAVYTVCRPVNGPIHPWPRRGQEPKASHRGQEPTCIASHRAQ